MNSRRLVEALKQIPLQVLLLMVAGIISVFVTMIPQICYKALIWFGEGLDTKEPIGIGYFIIGIVGLIACVVSMYIFMKRPGVDDAIIAKMDEGDSARLNPLYPLIVIVVSLLIYAGICFVIDYQFLAGPVQFFAPYLAKLPPNGEFGTIGFDIKIISFAILVVCEIPAMFLGYMHGFKQRMSGKQLL